MNLSGFHPEARAEFLAAVAYYAERDSDLAAGFILEVERGVNLARTEPQSGNPVAPGEDASSCADFHMLFCSAAALALRSLRSRITAAAPGTGCAVSVERAIQIVARLQIEPVLRRLTEAAPQAQRHVRRHRAFSLGAPAGPLDPVRMFAPCVSSPPGKTAPRTSGERDVDGLLTMEEVLGLKLNADWVVLSACNTAAADGKGDEAVSGLGRAFFFAGARALLVSNWPVETVSARLITTDLFRRQVADPTLSRAEALQRTLVDLIDAGSAKGADGKLIFTYAHPMFWAPFTLVGEGAAR